MLLNVVLWRLVIVKQSFTCLSLLNFIQLLECNLPATTTIPEFTRIPENTATTIFSGIRVGICNFKSGIHIEPFATIVIAGFKRSLREKIP